MSLKPNTYQKWRALYQSVLIDLAQRVIHCHDKRVFFYEEKDYGSTRNIHKVVARAIRVKRMLRACHEAQGEDVQEALQDMLDEVLGQEEGEE